MSALNTVYILWLRQIKKYVRSKPRMISSLGQPLLFLFAFWFGFGPVFQKAGGGDYLTFLVPGIIAMSIMSISMFMGIEVIWDKQFGFLKETLAAPVSRLSIVIGRTLGGATVAVAQGIIVFLISLLIGFRPASMSYLVVAVLFMFLMGLLFTAFGTAIASVLEDMHAFPVIMNFLIMPLFFLSGALFPLDGLPDSIRMISYFDPLSYGVDGLRFALVSVSHFGIFMDLSVLTGTIVLIFALAAYLFSRIEV
jgi:ABC-2 type transport system permease protein